jgi:hypothetical protein
MCDAIGHPVDHLKRVAIGPLRDARLKIGYWRDLSEEEVRRLRTAADTKQTTENNGRNVKRTPRKREISESTRRAPRSRR